MKDLPGGSIVPAAQGVDAFIRPTAFQQAPGLSQLRVFNSNVPQINQIRQGSGGSVQGFNQWAQLATALAPFNDALTRTAMAGGEMYASNEYQKGRNDAIKAQILSNQQRLQGGAAWNAETRRLEGLDPEAAQMMDRVNPFRQAGRDNQRARMAAEETKTYILDAYRSTPGAETWRAGDPRLAEIKVKATQQILSRFGLDQSSAGFQDYVNPEIAQAWDRVSTEQQSDHQKWAGDTIPRMTAVEMLLQFRNARAAGMVEWMDEDPATQQPVRRQARLGDAEFNYGVGRRLAQTLGRIQGEVGLRGNVTKAMREAALQAQQMAAVAAMDPKAAAEAEALQEFVEIVGGLEVGPPGRNGKRATVADLFAPEAYAQAKELRKDAFDLQAQAEARAFQGFANEATIELLNNPAGTPGYEAARQRLIQKALGMGLPMDKAISTLDSVGGNIESIALRGVDATDVQDHLADLKARDPSDFNLAQERDILKGKIANMPKNEQAKHLAELGRIAESKSKEAQNGRGAILNPILTQGIKAALRQEYPKDITEASLRGVKDIAGFMAMGDVNMEAAAARLRQGATLHMQRRLDEYARTKGERLTNTEQTAVATDAFNEYMGMVKKDEALRKRMFPGGLTGGDSVPGGKPAKPNQNIRGESVPAPPPGRVYSKAPVVSSSNLDNVDPQLLKSGAVVLEKPSAMNEVERVLLGRPPSAAVQRAARAAGMSAGQWLLRQMDGYPGSLAPQTRRELLRRVNQGQAAGQKVSSSAVPGNPFGGAAGWLADLMFGTRRVMASQGGGGSEFPFTRRPEAGGDFPSGGRYTPIRGITITSRVDPNSLAGFDMASGSSRSAQLAWPTSFEVIEVVRNDNREIRKERGGSGSSYGNFVRFRFRDPVSGRMVETISAHHDKINPSLLAGRRYPAGTGLGNQGRTGSTTGPHWSLDFFDPGGRSASSETRKTRDRMRDGFASGSTFGNGGGRSPSGGGGAGRNETRFLSFLSELESDGRNNVASYAEAQGGGRAMGRFQFTPITLLDAEQRFGISRRRLLSDDARVQNAAVMEFIRKAHPDAAAAIRAGRFDRAEQLLNRRWVSLRGGSEEARPERRQRALRFLRN